MGSDLLSTFAQFGPAGLIGVLWLAERRFAATRERQLSEAHRRLTGHQHSIDALLEVVRDNTRAIAALEHTQRQVIDLARSLLAGRAGGPQGVA